MSNFIKPTKKLQTRIDTHIFFDSDVLIDVVKLDLRSEFNKIFDKVDKCILNSTKIEILNTRNKKEFIDLVELINGFWQIPLLNKDLLIAEKLQEYNTRLNKCPTLGDYLIASKLISFGGDNVFILTGNIQDFSGEVFDHINTFDVFGNGKRKIWGLITKTKKFNSKKNVLEERS